MLTPIAENIWSAQHAFVVNGVPSTTRMTVVKLNDGSLWVHSPIPVNAALRAQIDGLGPVRNVVAPSLAHHLFVTDFAATYPDARLFGAPGLPAKRPDITDLQTLQVGSAQWEPELVFLLFGGMLILIMLYKREGLIPESRLKAILHEADDTTSNIPGHN